MGTVNIGYHLNTGNFINVLSERLGKNSRHPYYAILFSGASAERHNYRNRTTCTHRKRTEELNEVAQHGVHTPADRLTKSYSLVFIQRTSLMLEIR